MTPQELKSSILQLAVQGKLVEQRPDEGTGEELYKQIQTEKQKLIAEGKLKKEKPLPKITEDEIPFEIPESWKWVRLNEIAITGLGKTLNKATDQGDLCQYLCSINVYWEGIDLDIIKEARFTDNDKKKYKLEIGDLLICEGGDAGRCAIWTEDRTMYYQNALHRVRFYGNISAEYFRSIFELYKSNGIIKKHCKGETIKHLVQNELYSILFPLPPLAEQKRIVAKIEELLPLIDRYEQAWTKLEAFNKRFPDDMQKSVLQMAIQGKLVEQRPEEGTGEELYRQIQAEKQNFIKEGKIKKEKPLPEITEDEILFDIPESWKWCRIGSVFTTSSGTTPLKSETAYWENGIFNWVRTTDLNNDILSECEIKITKKAIDECNLSFLPLNSVCIAMYGGAGTIGKNALINFETTINQSVCAIHSNRFCNMKYMLYFFQYYRKYWIKSASGSRKDPNINKIIINKAIFPLPPLAEQKRIVQKLEEILPLCEKLK